MIDYRTLMAKLYTNAADILLRNQKIIDELEEKSCVVGSEILFTV